MIGLPIYNTLNNPTLKPVSELSILQIQGQHTIIVFLHGRHLKNSNNYISHQERNA